MRRKVACLALATSLLGGALAVAQDRSGYTHVVRPGETLASIAQRYYGDPRRETVLVTENGLGGQVGMPIVVGLRLAVPWVTYHRVAEGETWAQLAERFYGDPRRAFLLTEVNGGSAEPPPEGAELVVPYPLRHVAAQGETVSRVAKLYYGESAEQARRMRRFNNLRGNRVTRGQVLLVPLEDLVLSDEGRRLVSEEVGTPPPAGEVRELQQAIGEQLPLLGQYVRGGRYAEAVALGNHLLGQGELTGNQVVSIQRELGTAYVALDREDLATQAFREALARQPDLVLDSMDTSPIVLRAFQRARQGQGSAPPPVARAGDEAQRRDAARSGERAPSPTAEPGANAAD